MPSHFHRRNSIIDQLKKFSINNYQFIDGVDVETTNVPIDLEAFKLNRGRIPVPQELGCYAAHGNALKEIIASNQHGFVLEDDAILYDDFLDLYSNLPPNFDFDIIFPYHASSFIGQPEKMFVPIEKQHVFTNIDYNSWITVAYVVSFNFAKKLYENLYPMTDVADAWNHKYTDKFFATGNSYVQHGYFESSMANRDSNSPYFGTHIFGRG
jgi:GR25 family glycosyltransferase involved in LPS biosynthesis